MRNKPRFSPVFATAIMLAVAMTLFPARKLDPSQRVYGKFGSQMIELANALSRGRTQPDLEVELTRFMNEAAGVTIDDGEGDVVEDGHVEDPYDNDLIDKSMLEDAAMDACMSSLSMTDGLYGDLVPELDDECRTMVEDCMAEGDCWWVVDEGCADEGLASAVEVTEVACAQVLND